MNKRKFLLIVIILLLTVIFCLSYIFNSNKFQKLFSYNQTQLIKKYIFPYKYIDQLELKILDLPNVEKELQFKKSKKTLQVAKKKDIKLSNDKILKSYIITEGFYSGIHKDYPGSGYLDFYKDNLLIMSSRGILAFSKNFELNFEFNQIENNIENFINLEHFKKDKSFSIKDILVSDNKLFVSFTEEIIEDCWNTSVVFGDINLQNIEFKKLFSSIECIHSLKNIDNEFSAHQSGGRIIRFDKKHILLSVGEYRSRFHAQRENSVNGKIIKININNSKYETISMGHRNPQGLYFDKKRNFVLETEHGPKGGDEINLIEIDKISKNKILNYGWPISSAGEHYGKKDIKKYKKYPLYKSHKEYGFIEPLKSFVPSIAISEITKIDDNNYALGSMKNKSIYFFELNKNKKIENIERVEVFERVRDLVFKHNNLYLFLENSASIGVIDLN